MTRALRQPEHYCLVSRRYGIRQKTAATVALLMEPFQELEFVLAQ